MSTDLLLRDLLTWSLQVAVLVTVAAVFPALIRLRTPGAKLLYWQTVLLACLGLPLLRTWQRPVAAGMRFVHTAVITPASPAVESAAPFSAVDVIAWALLLGIFVRLSLLGAGFVRLRHYRRNSVPLRPESTWGVEAALLVSEEIASPVTFGFRRPVVLLPANFAAMDEPARNAVLCHEILHVRRADWLFTLGEEFIRALLWFHPAVWWTLGEIQLAREQTVDRAVIDMTNSSDEYVDALLSIAGASGGLDVAPAPLFLRKRHLKQRVFSILKEVRMSQKKTLSTLAAGLALVAGSCWFITGALPLEGAPQSIADGEGVAVEMNGAQLMHRSSVYYPRDAESKGIEGTVVAQVRTDASGNVVDASILSGPDELRKPVLESVLGWHFAKDSAQTTRQILIRFSLPKTAALAPRPTSAVMVGGVIGGVIGAPGATRSITIKAIDVNGLSDEVRAQLLRALPFHEGETVSMQEYRQLLAAVSGFDEHLRTVMMGSDGGTSLIISTPNAPSTTPGMMKAAIAPRPAVPGQIRVGGAVQAANLVSQVPPAYPPLAKQARVQGTVKFDAAIGKDGSVTNLTLISGPPLLVQAALVAVQQWVYKPTLLNGQPVDVITTIDVNFTLSQ